MPVDRGIDIPNVLRPGFQAPAKAQLNLDLGLGVLTPSPQNQPTTTIRLISNADFSYGGGKNGTPQMQPFKTARVFADDLKARKRVRINSEGQLSTGLIPNPFPMLISVTTQAKMEHLNGSLPRSSATRGNAPGWTLRVSYRLEIPFQC